MSVPVLSSVQVALTCVAASVNGADASSATFLFTPAAAAAAVGPAPTAVGSVTIVAPTGAYAPGTVYIFTATVP